MTTLTLIGLVILGIILVIGLIRVASAPYAGFVNLLMEFMLIDWLLEAIFWVIESIGDVFD